MPIHRKIEGSPAAGSIYTMFRPDRPVKSARPAADFGPTGCRLRPDRLQTSARPAAKFGPTGCEFWPDRPLRSVRPAANFGPTGCRIWPERLQISARPAAFLARPTNPEATSVGEKTYRNIKLRLLDWNLCRALIMSPRQVACQLRGSMAQAELFNKAVEPLKHTMRSRELTSEALSTDGESNYTSRSKRRRCQSSSSDDEYPVRTEKPMKRRRRVLSSSSEEDVNETRLRRVESMVENLYHLVSGNKENDGSVMNSTWQAPTPTGEELYDADSIGTCGSVNDWDTFSPVTREIEPTVPRADPVIETQGMKCQRFGEETWNKVRYVDAQKKLHASPVFSTLKVNSSLYNNGHASPMTDMLSKSDLAFGTISHGLLKQRRIIHEALKEAGNKHPEAADTLKKFLPLTVNTRPSRTTCCSSFAEKGRKSSKVAGNYTSLKVVTIGPSSMRFLRQVRTCGMKSS
ncbi:unnamed protein product [Acanthoscelides obtectus]|uniref:Uncharacterized protein n=1 Tax=Acanthoscelides obtectus TaxID=200917 RepID=A0A9P0VPP9_ACAOB|nr:unnamed protein product [Acanthoscelides obtectus]CAK1630949.1 hypothetical protein AOBTE_LOCUS6667 [Acanthoscelides obtectus]